jgi:Cu2+-containing amine oxidase
MHARYLFNIHHRLARSSLTVNPEGNDLPDTNAAREHVQCHARDMIARTNTDIVRDWMVCSFEVTDEAGQPVLTVPFSDMI